MKPGSLARSDPFIHFKQGSHVSMNRVTDIDAVGTKWLELQKHSNASFFQSWVWVRTWLTSVLPRIPVYLLETLADDQVVGLAVVARHSELRRGLVRSRQFRITETGDAILDSPTVEHNGLLLREGTQVEALNRVLGWLRESVSGWNELVISGLEESALPDYERASQSAGLDLLADYSKPYYRIDLDDIRHDGGDYLQALSANSRYQVRRALRDCKKFGALSYRVASSTTEADHFLTELMSLHQKRWRERDQAGAFATDFTREFHHALIQTGMRSGTVQLARILAGGHLFGYLYNFVHGGVVYNYQSGFDYQLDTKLKPGIVGHILAIRHALETGAHSYDFLMGDQQYKRSLATQRGLMYWIRIQRTGGILGVETALRRLKRRLGGL